MQTDTQELRLLKYLIENPLWLTKTHNEIFSNDKYCGLKRQLTEMVKKGKEISWSLLEYKAKTPESLKFIQSIKEAEALDRPLFLEIRTELREKALIKKANSIAELQDPKIIKQLVKDLTDLQSDDVPKELNKPINFFDFEKHIRPKDVYLDSGIQPFRGTGTDTKIGDVFNILAPSGNFKTGLMTHQAKHHLAVKRNVLFFSMEENAQSFLSRVGMGFLSKTPYQYAQMTPDELRESFNGRSYGNLDVISGEIIYVEDLQDTIETLETEKGYKYDVIIIDYSAQIDVRNANKNLREDQKIEKIFRDLKVIAMSPVNPKLIITAIQSNRMGYNRKKGTDVTNTAGSMGGVHVADLMVSVNYAPNPDAPQRPTEADEQPTDAKGFVKLKIVKKRTGTLKVDDTFYFTHTADGNMRFMGSKDDRMELLTMEQINQLDSLFGTEDTPQRYRDETNTNVNI